MFSAALCAALLPVSGLFAGGHFPAAAEVIEDISLFSAMFALPEGRQKYINDKISAAISAPEQPGETTVYPGDVPTYVDSETEQTGADTAEEIPSSTSPSSGSESPLPEAAKGRVITTALKKETGNRSSGLVYLSKNTDTDVDIAAELKKSPDVKLTLGSKPEVLIIHTHTSESYLKNDVGYYTASDTVNSTNNSENICKVGDAIAAVLKANGISVLHDKTMHNEPEFTGSYTRSAATIKKNLEKYPTIKVVLDIHRDSITKDNGDKVKTTVEIGGKKAAQVMLVQGCNEGAVKGYDDWKSNLRMSLKVQQELEKSYPGLARPVRLVAARYNQQLTKGSMLIEMGTEANTLEEAIYSGEMVGKALSTVFKTLAK